MLNDLNRIDGVHLQITLPEAARLPQLQYNGRGPNLATVWRWSDRGVRGVKLETWMVGGRKVTTPAAVDRFLAALSAPAAVAPPPPAKTVSAHRRAELELRAAGI
jgi:hypothetical protein